MNLGKPRHNFTRIPTHMHGPMGTYVMNGQVINADPKTCIFLVHSFSQEQNGDILIEAEAFTSAGSRVRGVWVNGRNESFYCEDLETEKLFRGVNLDLFPFPTISPLVPVSGPTAIPTSGWNGQHTTMPPQRASIQGPPQSYPKNHPAFKPVKVAMTVNGKVQEFEVEGVEIQHHGEARCECGSEAIGAGSHSAWCPKSLKEIQ